MHILARKNFSPDPRRDPPSRRRRHSTSAREGEREELVAREFDELMRRLCMRVCGYMFDYWLTANSAKIRTQDLNFTSCLIQKKISLQNNSHFGRKLYILL